MFPLFVAGLCKKGVFLLKHFGKAFKNYSEIHLQYEITRRKSGAYYWRCPWHR